MDICSTEQSVYAVSELSNLAKDLLEGRFARVCIAGEISNLACPSSGHWYFSLKDDKAQIRCAMFRGQNRRVPWQPDNGQQVLVYGKISLYTPRGDFQLIAEELEEAGIGALRRAFEQLKKRLAQEGLFATEHKQILPDLPQRIGIITSATGAALQDSLNVLKRRFACANVIIYPSLVQGEQAATHIVKAIQTANRRDECDVLLLVRGGGSLEDLWPFNEEVVARAIAASQLPIVTGVGHEIDTTIADYVADFSCPTPSAAAEIVTPDAQELSWQIQQSKQQLIRLIHHTIKNQQQHLQLLQSKLIHPQQHIREQAQRLDLLEQRLHQCQHKQLQQAKIRLQQLSARLQHPQLQISQANNRCQQLRQQLNHHMQQHLQQQKHSLNHLAARLHTLSPLATLQRGYAIASNAANGKIINSAEQITSGDKLRVRLAHDELLCTVD